MTTTTTDGCGLLAELLAAKQLDIGIIWHCASCPVQGRRIHHHIDAARHDAAYHAIGHHRDTFALTHITLRLIGERERQVRLTSARDTAVLLVPPLEPWDTDPLSPLQLERACDAVDCAPDARHRRRRKETAAVDERTPAPPMPRR
ncbi:hypothetical protein [Streptomyces sp. SID3343]|uniref:hypothetical protein n=1 Tax=Streptomyces sp. SID3343 TaxID=2690260 RepID=UPI00136A8408|nr:hypothetical protein [Streptomyces sp. SID3343]MYW00375.1 hypothetical protein [Streptomyces sp. SID3343]